MKKKTKTHGGSRPGAGRKKGVVYKPTVTASFRVDAEDYKKVRAKYERGELNNKFREFLKSLIC